MKEPRKKIELYVPRQRFLATVSLGAVLSSMFVWATPVRAQVTCGASGTTSCTNNGSTAFTNGLVVQAGAIVDLFTNTMTGVVGGPTALVGVKNNGTITALYNENGGLIDATAVNGGDSNGINNYNEFGTITNNGVIEATTTGNGYSNGVFNNGTISTITNNGVIEATTTGNGYSISNGILNYSSIGSLTNSGEIYGIIAGSGYAYGVYNSSAIEQLTNTGTIKGSTAGNGFDFGIVNNGSGIITTLTNAGIIEGVGANSSYGIDNGGIIGTLENSGEIKSLGAGNSILNIGTIGGLVNSGEITGSSVALVNYGTINTLMNSGLITSPNDAIDLIGGSQLGAFTNSGIIAGTIDNETTNNLLVTGGMGTTFGTLTGYNGTQGTIISSNANIDFSSGNLILNDNLVAGSGSGTVSNSGATLLVGGNTPNTLTITGNYKQSSNGTLEMEISPTPLKAIPVAGTDYSQLLVDGTAQLAGTLVIFAGQGHYGVGTSYNVIQTTGGITGSLASKLAGAYGQYLRAASGVSPNQDNYVVTITGFTAAGAPSQAFTSGHFYGASLYAQNASLFAALSSVYGTGVGYWLHGLGSFGHTPGVSYNYKGFVAGRGFAVTQHLIVGGAVSNVYNNTSEATSSSVNGSNVGALAYGIYNLPKWTFTGEATVGHLGNTATRYLSGVGVGRFATNGVYSGVSLRAEYSLLTHAHLFVSPYAGVSYLYTTTGSGQETGLNRQFNMNLHYARTSTSLAQTTGGLKVGYKSNVPYGVLTYWASLGGAGILGNTHERVEETLGLETAGVSAQIASVGEFTPAVGVLLAGQNEAWKLSTDWNGQFSKRSNAQALTLNGSYKF